ncbi:MAG: response regulator transcription factor [Planctomycetota bacterium]|nr:response regulator transcription factor [Planctomycetota bacterium]
MTSSCSTWLPGLDGLEVCRALRRDGNRTPIIVLTARGGGDDRVRGLQVGADDYVAKPFSVRELLARVAAQLRRGEWGAAASGPALEAGDVTVDLGRLEARRGSRRSRRSRRARWRSSAGHHRGRIVSRAEFLTAVWGYPAGAAIETRTVENTIVKLRHKVERDPRRPALVLGARRRLGWAGECDATPDRPGPPRRPAWPWPWRSSTRSAGPGSPPRLPQLDDDDRRARAAALGSRPRRAGGRPRAAPAPPGRAAVPLARALPPARTWSRRRWPSSPRRWPSGRRTIAWPPTSSCGGHLRPGDGEGEAQAAADARRRSRRSRRSRRRSRPWRRRGPAGTDSWTPSCARPTPRPGEAAAAPASSGPPRAGHAQERVGRLPEPRRQAVRWPAPRCSSAPASPSRCACSLSAGCATTRTRTAGRWPS